MWLFLIFVLVFASFSVFCQDHLQLNKCCPQGQNFDADLNCVSSSKNNDSYWLDGDEKETFFWFPMDSIVNGTTLKIHEHYREQYLYLLKTYFKVNYGKMPKCSSDQTTQIAYFKRDVINIYHFIMYENNTMRVHVSKPGSRHESEDIWYFPVINRDPESTPLLPTSSSDLLRTFPLSDVCVELGYKNIHFLVYCPCRTMVCIRKCCGDGEYYNATSNECEFGGKPLVSGGNWRPKMTNIINQYYLLSDTFPSCENPLLLKVPNHSYKACNRFNKESDNDFTIFNNGSIKVRKYKNLYEPHQYCGEVTWHENGNIYEQNLILCSALKNEQMNLKPIKSIIYGTLLIFGGICLFITVAISLYLPELRRRMHNKIALSHNASLMVAYFTWAIGQLSPNLGDKSCMLIALIIQFTFLGSFFWLNVMCIDISMTFSSTRSLGQSNVEIYKKFLCYCIYSWGLTTIISIITMIMEYLPDVPYDFLKPGFACSCGFNTANASILVYFYGPMSILLIFNLVLFIFTTLKIMTVQRMTAILHKTDSNTIGGSSFQSDKQRYDLIQWLILYAKLFLLMGLTWITEIISWAVGGPDYYWYFSDILNLLRAVFIFILFIWKKSVYESLKRKFFKRSMIASKDGCSKSFSEHLSSSNSLRESKYKSSLTNKMKKDSGKEESESQKFISPKEINSKNLLSEESIV